MCTQWNNCAISQSLLSFTGTLVPIIGRGHGKNGNSSGSCDVSAVGNVARVLRLFTAERSLLSVTEVAQELGLPKSSTSRLLKSMSNAGLLASADRSSGYGVGNLIFETSRCHRAHSTLSVLADEVLAGIARSTG